MKRSQSECADSLVQLEQLLLEARDNHIPSLDIAQQLEATGVAVVPVDSDCVARVKRLVGARLAATFSLLGEATKVELREQGCFERLSQEWSQQVGMALKSCRMPNKVPLQASARQPFTYAPLGGTVHSYNPLMALTAVDIWDLLGSLDSQLSPGAWSGWERWQVSEDGVKVAHHDKYTPTAIHYDGQPNRIQIVFTADSGPTHLYAVPGSGSEQAQRLICNILGLSWSDMGRGFSTHKAAMSSEAGVELKRLLHRFGVRVSASGLLAFRTGVWHFESEGPTSGSQVFRVYCGVVCATQASTETLIRFAYLREQGWAMEPFATKENCKQPLFVAEKTSQSPERRDYSEDRPAFAAIKAMGLEQMKQHLRALSAERLALYGINREQDLNTLF
jgi:hypothetical protein